MFGLNCPDRCWESPVTNRSPRTTILCFALALGIASLLTACNSSEPPELKQAADVVQYMMSPRNLSRTAFTSMYPEGKASDFVSYMFSTIGTAEWPPSEDGVDEGALEAAHSIGIPTIPAGLEIIPRKWKAGQALQLLVSADDTKGVVILEGYLAEYADPVMRREITMHRNDTATGGMGH